MKTHQASTSRDLSNHNKAIHAVHIRKKFQCDQCDYQTNAKHYLKLHIQVIHFGLRYQCELCDDNYQTQQGLKLHKDAHHFGKKDQCDLCDYQTTQAGTLN